MMDGKKKREECWSLVLLQVHRDRARGLLGTATWTLTQLVKHTGGVKH